MKRANTQNQVGGEDEMARPAVVVVAWVAGFVGGGVACASAAWTLFGLNGAGADHGWAVLDGVIGCSLISGAIGLMRRRMLGRTVLICAASADLILWLVGVGLVLTADEDEINPIFSPIAAAVVTALVSLPLYVPTIVALVSALRPATRRWLAAQSGQA